MKTAQESESMRLFMSNESRYFCFPTKIFTFSHVLTHSKNMARETKERNFQIERSQIHMIDAPT